MLKKFIRICLIFILIGGGIVLYKQPNLLHFAPSLPSVKGVNTSKGNDISEQLKSEVNSSLNQVGKQAMNIKISDLLNFFSRTQKIGNDFKGFQEYIKHEVDNFVKKK